MNLVALYIRYQSSFEEVAAFRMTMPRLQKLVIDDHGEAITTRILFPWNNASMKLPLNLTRPPPPVDIWYADYGEHINRDRFR